MKTPFTQSGQILLITLLVVSVAVTIVLSIIGRATTDVAISNQVAESSRAFNAAEAGIEQALKTGVGTGTNQMTIGSDAKYSVTMTSIGGALGVYSFPNKTSLGQTETLWLASPTSPDTTNMYQGSSFDLCWSSETTMPAMSIAIFYKTAGGAYQVARGAYDPDKNVAGARSTSNNFSPVTAMTGGCGDSATTYKQTITFSDFGITGGILLMARITPLYNAAKIVINAPSMLPLQGSRFESTGSLASGVARKIVVFQQFRTPPSLFDSVIYSQNNFGH